MKKERKLVLIADDDVDLLNQMVFHLNKFGFDTISAESQKECEKIIDDTKPDIAVFDLMMENEDSGFILSYRLKKKHPDVPVIIATSVSSVTGYVFEPENTFDKNWIKADKYLEKGIRPDQLHREINKLLKL